MLRQSNIGDQALIVCWISILGILVSGVIVHFFPCWITVWLLEFFSMMAMVTLPIRGILELIEAYKETEDDE